MGVLKIPALLYIDQAATLLKCSREQVFKLLRAGKLDRAEQFGRRAVVTGASVNRLIGPQRHEHRRKAYDRVQAERQLRDLYGIDFEDWARLYEAQQGLCPGCEKPLRFGSNTHVDHCHASRRVRGLLCSGCNHALGKVRDDPDTLLRLLAYLDPLRTGTQTALQQASGT